MLGAVSGDSVCGRSRHGNHLPQMAHNSLALGLTPREQAQLEVLRALAVGGRGTLRTMAAENGRSETGFLYQLAGLPPPSLVGPPSGMAGGAAYGPY